MKRVIEVSEHNFVVLVIDNVGTKEVGKQATVHPYVLSQLKVIKEDKLHTKGFYHDDPGMRPSWKRLDWKAKLGETDCFEKKMDLAEEVVGV